jgi:hypothetical protein
LLYISQNAIQVIDNQRFKLITSPVIKLCHVINAYLRSPHAPAIRREPLSVALNFLDQLAGVN